MNQPPRDPHARAPVNLTLEEIEVLKECRVNSVYYRGLPLGILSALAARGAIQTGYFPFLKRWSKAVYTGVFGLGFFTGILSYREICFKKIMSLENSTLKEQFLQFQKQNSILTMGTSEFSEESPPAFEATRRTKEDNDQENTEQPLIRQVQERSKWEDIRQQSRQPTVDKGGISYEDLRNRNREQSHTPKARRGDEQSPRTDFESFSQPRFEEEKSSRALDFDSENTSLSLQSGQHQQDQNDTARSSLQRKRRAGYNQATTRKNQYGDEME